MKNIELSLFLLIPNCSISFQSIIILSIIFMMFISNNLKHYLLSKAISCFLIFPMIYVITFCNRLKQFIINSSINPFFDFKILIFSAVIGLLIGLSIGFIRSKIETEIIRSENFLIHNLPSPSIKIKKIILRGDYYEKLEN